MRSGVFNFQSVLARSFGVTHPTPISPNLAYFGFTSVMVRALGHSGTMRIQGVKKIEKA